MKPLERNFRAPTLDFFKPTGSGSYELVGLELQKDGSMEVLANNGKTQGYVRHPYEKGRIKGARLNDLGGLSIDFSRMVTYLGNEEGDAILSQYNDHVFIYGFELEAVARVRKNNGRVVWENPEVPEERTLLQVVEKKVLQTAYTGQ